LDEELKRTKRPYNIIEAAKKRAIPYGKRVLTSP